MQPSVSTGVPGGTQHVPQSSQQLVHLVQASEPESVQSHGSFGPEQLELTSQPHV